MLNLADPHGRAHVPVADRRDEVLTTDLLRITIPALLYGAETSYTDPQDVIAHQQGKGVPDVRRDFILRSGKIYTWQPPRGDRAGRRGG